MGCAQPTSTDHLVRDNQSNANKSA